MPTWENIPLRERLRIRWHNLMLPYREWRRRRKLLPVWVAEGRDPRHFPKKAKVTPEAYLWAREAAERVRRDGNGS